MAFSARPTQTQPSISEINVTPLVDVMLVLLIIFMVTAPILNTGIEVNLPQSREAQPSDPERQAVITISRGEQLYYRAQLANFYQLGELLKNDVGDTDKPIFLQADEDVRWKTLVAVVDEIRASGFNTISLVTKPVPREEE